jgi:hypothetical protein
MFLTLLLMMMLPGAVQITIAYVDPGATRQQQREALCEMYFFDQEAVPSSTAAIHGSTAAGTTEAEVPLPPGQYMRLRPEPLASVTADLPNLQLDTALKNTAPKQPGPSFLASLRNNMLGAEKSMSGLGGFSSSESAPKVQVKVYGLGPTPPWPTGRADAQLTQVLVLEPGAGGMSLQAGQVGSNWVTDTSARGHQNSRQALPCPPILYGGVVKACGQQQL